MMIEGGLMSLKPKCLDILEECSIGNDNKEKSDKIVHRNLTFWSTFVAKRLTFFYIRRWFEGVDSRLL